MIYVTQGHELGIGLEIFFKSFLMLSNEQKKQITLVCTKKSFENNLKDLKFKINELKGLNTFLLDDTIECPSTTTLLYTLGVIKESDILITLPTSKDQLILNGDKKAGYTEFFREYYSNSNISMTFKAEKSNVLLISDHIKLSDVPNFITSDLIVNKTITTLNFYEKYFYKFDEVLFSGINPHVGENGILGHEDNVIFHAVKKLQEMCPETNFKGPFSGDTLHIHEKTSINQLQVYMFHDQGLAKFKSQFGMIGLNISMGLPFLRLSVDHGTAFELYGKNKANALSMMYLFKIAFEVLDHVNKRN